MKELGKPLTITGPMLRLQEQDGMQYLRRQGNESEARVLLRLNVGAGIGQIGVISMMSRSNPLRNGHLLVSHIGRPQKRLVVTSSLSEPETEETEAEREVDKPGVRVLHEGWAGGGDPAMPEQWEMQEFGRDATLIILHRIHAGRLAGRVILWESTQQLQRFYETLIERTPEATA